MGVLAIAGGLPGVLAGAGVALATRVGSIPLAFGAAHVGVVSLQEPGSALFFLEGGAGLLVIGALVAVPGWKRLVVGWTSLTATTVLLVTEATVSPGQLAILLLVGTGLAMYGIHRYEVVRLGVTDDHE